VTRRTLTLTVAIALLACGSPPPKNDKERHRTTVLSSPEVEEDVGREVAKQVEAEIGLVEDEALRRYVQAVGARLARHAPGFRYDYHFEIADEPAPNAFALPGGRIFVSRGALALMASEDELANVLGHEIAHVAARHAAAQQRLAGGAVMRVLQMPYLASYSRDLERTADRVGQGLAAVSGYDPEGMARFLAALDRLDRVQRGTSRRPGFLDSHPGTPGRVHEMSQRAGTIHWSRSPGIAEGSGGYLARVDGLVVGPDPSQGIFDGPRFLHPELLFTFRLPDGFQTHNTPRAVGGISADRRMQILLELAGEGSDLAGAAQDFLDEVGRSLALRQLGPVRVGGRDAYRVTGSLGGGELISTFLPYRGLVYRLSCAGSNRKQVEAFCAVTTRSFRPLTPDLLRGVSGLRLAVIPARGGESLAMLSARSQNAWTPAETAAWNARGPESPLSAGESVKIAREVPWTPGDR
jgi:predicted Zn-dependent protease